jgi:hypothetical protein
MKVVKRFALLFLLIAIPFPLLADTVTFSNTGGKFNSNAAKTTLSLTGSGLFAVSGLSGFGVTNTSLALPCGACLGSVTLTTATLASGQLAATGPTSVGSIATFNPGGTFKVTSTLGGGIVFQGSFSNSTWTKSAPGTWTFLGTIMNGTLSIGGGSPATITTAATVQLTTAGSGFTTNSNGSVTFANSAGTTNFAAPVPEPGTLALLGSGLVFVGTFAKHRAMRRGNNAG